MLKNIKYLIYVSLSILAVIIILGIIYSSYYSIVSGESLFTPLFLLFFFIITVFSLPATIFFCGEDLDYTSSLDGVSTVIDQASSYKDFFVSSCEGFGTSLTTPGVIFVVVCWIALISFITFLVIKRKSRKIRMGMLLTLVFLIIYGIIFWIVDTKKASRYERVCMKAVKTYEKKMYSCTMSKLKSAGYNDNFDCWGSYDFSREDKNIEEKYNTICTDDRSQKQIDFQDECDQQYATGFYEPSGISFRINGVESDEDLLTYCSYTDDEAFGGGYESSFDELRIFEKFVKNIQY